MQIALMIIAVLLLAAFGLVVFVGSPFVRTHKMPVQTALDLLEIKEGSHLLDLGSGDGAILLAGAQRGAIVTGYELNPIMWLISKWRLRKYPAQATIRLGNMWNAPIDDETENIFIFLDSRFLKRLDKKLKVSGSKLSLASYSYRIIGKRIIKTKNGVHLYKYNENR